jgi:hypothetical protein
MVAVLTCPPGLVAVAVSTLPPSSSGTPDAVKEPPAAVAGWPLTVTVAAASLTVPETATVVEAMKLKSAGDVMATPGKEKRTTERVASVSLPAMSKACKAMALVPSTRDTCAWKLPSALLATGWPATETRAMPLSSLTWPVTCTLAELIRAPEAGLSTVNVGGVVSRVTRAEATPTLP